MNSGHGITVDKYIRSGDNQQRWKHTSMDEGSFHEGVREGTRIEDELLLSQRRIGNHKQTNKPRSHHHHLRVLIRPDIFSLSSVCHPMPPANRPTSRRRLPDSFTIATMRPPKARALVKPYRAPGGRWWSFVRCASLLDPGTPRRAKIAEASFPGEAAPGGHGERGMGRGGGRLGTPTSQPGGIQGKGKGGGMASGKASDPCREHNHIPGTRPLTE